MCKGLRGVRAFTEPSAQLINDLMVERTRALKLCNVDAKGRDLSRKLVGGDGLLGISNSTHKVAIGGIEGSFKGGRFI